MKTDATYLSACVLSSLLWNLARKSFNMPLHWLVWAKRLYAKLFQSKETIGKQRIKISRIGLQPLPISYVSYTTIASSKGPFQIPLWSPLWRSKNSPKPKPTGKNMKVATYLSACVLSLLLWTLVSQNFNMPNLDWYGQKDFRPNCFKAKKQ